MALRTSESSDKDASSFPSISRSADVNDPALARGGARQHAKANTAVVRKIDLDALDIMGFAPLFRQLM